MKYLLKLTLLLPTIVFADIESAIKKRLYEKEGYEIQQIIQGSVNTYKSKVKIIQWTLLGPSYWRNYITVLDMSQGETEVTTKQVSGTVESIFIKNNLIFVTTKEQEPNDPSCCPSVKTERSYQLTDNGIFEVTHRLDNQ